MSGADLSQLSDSILSGQSAIDKLPSATRGQLVQYWQSLGVNFAQQDVAQSQLNSLNGIGRAQQNQSFLTSNPFGQALNMAFKPISLLGSLGHSLYSSVASPIVSFAALEAHSAFYGSDGSDDSMGDISSIWDKAHYISPGQSIWELGLNNNELKVRGISPEQMKSDKELQAKGQYFTQPTADNPWGTKSASDMYFNSGWSRNVTGALDAISSWYLDPLSKAGKIAGAAKLATYTRPIADVKLGLGVTLPGIMSKAAAGGGTAEEVGARLAENSDVQAVSNRIMQIKDQSQGTGSTVFNLRTQIGTLKDSTSGDALASLLASAKDQDEVNQVLRIGMGDKTALGNTLAQQGQLAANVASVNLSVTSADAYVSRLKAAGVPATSPTMANALASQDRYRTLLGNYIDQQNLVQQQRDAFGSIQNLNYNQTLHTANMAIRNALSTTATRAAALGNSFGPVGQFLVNTGNFAAKMVDLATDIKPTGWVDVHDPTSWQQVNASLKEVKGMDDATRQRYVGAYIAANSNQRGQILLGIEQGAVKNMVDQYNIGKAVDDQITPGMAKKIFQDYQIRRDNQVQSITSSRTSYSTANITGPSGAQVPADVYTNPTVFDFSNTGEALVASPILETQLLNHHVMMDFAGMRKAIDLYGSKWSTAAERASSALGTVVNVADTMNHYWKALQLIRPAYMPRALTDDFLGQVARFGAMSMAQRAIQGGKIMARDYWLSQGRKDDILTARVDFGLNEQHLEELGRQEQSMVTDLEGLTPGTPEHDTAQANLEQLQEHIQQMREKSLGLSQKIAGTGPEVGFKNVMSTAPGTRQVQVGRDVFSAPYGGHGGQMARDNIAGTRFAEMVNSDPANFYLRQLRQMGWGVVSAKDNELQHLMAWNRVLKNQIAQSYPGKLALSGETADSIAMKLRATPEGQQFVRDMGLKNRTEDDLAQRVVAHVDHMLNPIIPGTGEIRRSLLDGTYNMDMLKDVPRQVRPDVNGELWDYAIGKSKVSQMIDTGISGFYKWMGDVPSTRLLRNPLFKQEYTSYLYRQVENRQTQGIDWITQDERGLMENQARKFAMQQVKKYTYNMDHETKMQYAMRNMLAFLGPTAESWMRWGRIIADKPETLGKVANAYNAPSRAGITTDGSGNKVDEDGYAMVNGVKTFIPIPQRNMTIQIPDWLGGKTLANWLGIENASFKLPLSSMMMVMTEGDGYMPVGAGPIINIPLNHFAQSNPGLADWAQNAGLLPYGPQPEGAGIVPGWVKKTLDAFDNSTASRQNALGYLMQAETMKYHAGLRSTPPTWQELQDKADKFAIAKAIWSAVSPFSGDQSDPYQFFRDDYKRMQQLDPKTADEKFLEKYGDSFYNFSESMSKNNSGLAPTQQAVKLIGQMKSLNDATGGKYAGLIVGDEANNGTFSNGAYYYEKNTPMATGSTTNMRSDLSARDAWTQANVNRGWADYNQVLQSLNAQLIQRGLKTFSDPGASDLDQIRKNAIYLLTNKYKQDGSPNSLYNADFAADYGTQNKDKYNQNANELEQIVTDPAMWAKAYDSKTNTVGARSDIYTLRAYLVAREALTQQLDERGGAGGSSDINASSNDDLRLSFEQLTNQLIEQDTKFQAIHTRYFSGDMGYNTSTSPVVQQMLAEQAQGLTQSMAGQSGQFDIGPGLLAQEGSLGG